VGWMCPTTAPPHVNLPVYVNTSHTSKIDRGFLRSPPCASAFGTGVNDIRLNSLMTSSSSCSTMMFRLPPKLCGFGGDVVRSCVADAQRFLRDKDRNLAAVSPNSAVEVIVASSKRTVLRIFGVLLLDAGADWQLDEGYI